MDAFHTPGTWLSGVKLVQSRKVALKQLRHLLCHPSSMPFMVVSFSDCSRGICQFGWYPNVLLSLCCLWSSSMCPSCHREQVLRGHSLLYRGTLAKPLPHRYLRTTTLEGLLQSASMNIGYTKTQSRTRFSWQSCNTPSHLVCHPSNPKPACLV